MRSSWKRDTIRRASGVSAMTSLSRIRSRPPFDPPSRTAGSLSFWTQSWIVAGVHPEQVSQVLPDPARDEFRQDDGDIGGWILRLDPFDVVEQRLE